MTLTPPDPIGEMKSILQILFVIALVCVFGWLLWDNSRLRDENNQQQTEISTYQAANQAFAAETKECNDAVNQIKLDSDARLKAAAAAVAAIAAEQKKTTQTTTDLLKTKPDDPDDCAAAKKFAIQYFQGHP